ncbi:hypothetical protein FSP39_008468 [Pinctada imbricata]|uniref:G-protein coupled receptors family 1 profile domain-containing protein n=1 Tax=Pinctada imbricata TaxID=66713 RepID=A0AA88YUM1_PINIB|nr:hypothetical protein FSP39_008468 [Pinctada imbricata]
MTANMSTPSSINVTVDLTGKDFFETARLINGVILYPIICFPGIIGNIITLIVLSMKNMQTSTNAFLSALAVADIIKLTNDILYFFVLLLMRIDKDAAQTAYVHIYPQAHFIFNFSLCVSSWLTVTVAVERFILVCFPTKAKFICTRSRAIITCVIVYLVMVCFSLPCAFRYKTIYVYNNETGATIQDLEVSEMWSDKYFVTIYTWILNSLRCNIPLFILIILNTCIICSMRKARAKKNNSRRNRVTFMMITIIMCFLVFTTPDAIMSTFLKYGYHEANNYVKGMREFTDTLLTVNAAVNFIIYCWFGYTFRQNFKKLFCQRPSRGKEVFV